MTNRSNSQLESLLQVESDQVRKLHEIVVNSLKEEKLLTHKLRQQYAVKATVGQKVADQVARFGGSWKFIIAFLVILAVWIVANTYLISAEPFDPYPFILLNLILSTLAALQAPVIMMSQNRQEAKDRRRSEHDYLVNLKAELEIRTLHEKIDILLAEQMKVLLESQKRQLEILERLGQSNQR